MAISGGKGERVEASFLKSTIGTRLQILYIYMLIVSERHPILITQCALAIHRRGHNYVRALTVPVVLE